MRFATIIPLFLSSLCLSAATPSPCPAVQPAPPTSVPPPWDASGNTMLTGPHNFRYVQYTVGDQFGDLSRAIALYQTITFDGKGGYTISGLEVDSNSGTLSPCMLTGSGAYSISSSGFGYITNPLYPGELIWGLVSQVGSATTPTSTVTLPAGIFIGSTTETQVGYNDLFITAPMFAATNANLKGAYSVAYMNFPDGYVADIVAAGFQMSPNGGGSIGTVNIQAYKGATSAVDVPESVSYSFSSNGTGALAFPSYGPAIAGQEYLYISPDGTFVFGGSPNAFDIFVGVQTGPVSSTFGGLYYQAGIDETMSNPASGVVSGAIQTYYGAFKAVSGTMLNHQRVLAPFRTPVPPVGYGYNPYGYTSTGKYSIAFGSGGGYTDASGRQFVIGANGKIRIAFGATPALGIGVALQAPAFQAPAGSAIYLNPSGVVNAASYAPFTSGISPGELILIYGSNLGSPTQDPLTNNGLQVMINGVAATIQSVASDHLAVVVPTGISGTSAVIQVSNNTSSSTVYEYLNLTTPGVLTQAQNGLGDSLAVHANLSLVTPGNQAVIGENLTLFVTGLGNVIPSGLEVFGGYTPVNVITATIGGVPATIAYPNLSPPQKGVYQITVTVPSGVQAGEAALAIGGPDSLTNQATISVSAGSTK